MRWRFYLVNTTSVGSARIQGLGNTQISLGGDISSALSNPAGLGFYQKSEFSITPSFNILNTESKYLNNLTADNQNRFNIEGFGIVFNKSKGDLVPGAWRGGSFAISFNKVNEFHSRISYNGQNVNNDVLDYLVQFSNELNDDGVDISRQGPSLPRLAYNTYLTEFFPMEAMISSTGFSRIFLVNNSQLLKWKI